MIIYQKDGCYLRTKYWLTLENIENRLTMIFKKTIRSHKKIIKMKFSIKIKHTHFEISIKISTIQKNQRNIE